LDGECEECRKKRLSRKSRSLSQTGSEIVPPIVHEVLRSPGQPLDPNARSFMETRFGHDFSRVRVHMDAKAAESAQAVNALAYTIGQDVVFGAGKYEPLTGAGQRLLAHELAHVVQQSRGGSEPDAELRADAVAERISRGQPVVPEIVSRASFGLYREDDGESETPTTPETTSPLLISWDELVRFGMFQLPPATLTVPSFAGPSLLTPEELTLRPPGLTPPIITPSPLFPLPALVEFEEPFLGPAPSSEPEPGAPSLPSRLSIPGLRSGRFSVGLRLGFPELEAREILGAPPSALAEALRSAEILNQIITGEVPTGWEAIDKGKLAKFIWSVFSTHIAPDVARNVSSSLSENTGPGGLSFELDLVLLTDFSGGGLSFTAQY